MPFNAAGQIVAENGPVKIARRRPLSALPPLPLYPEVTVNTLDLWKNVEKLSVDEFMCLLFGLEPGTVKFDYGNPKDWPKNAALIYRMLVDDLQAKNLHVFFDDVDGDPFRNGAYDRFYAGNDNPWWADGGSLHGVGKLHKRELVKWLSRKGIPSEFFHSDGVNTGVSPQQPDESVAAPRSTGSSRDYTRIKATRQACEKVVESLNQEKQAFDNDKDHWEPKLLSDTGRIKKEDFMEAVQKRLGGGVKYHRDTAIEAWQAISADLKHRGRVPDQ